MGDLELVLRFFTLRGGTLNGMKFKDRLSDFMSIRNQEYINNKKLQPADEAIFEQAVSNCLLVFGEDAFRPQKDPNKKANRSAPYADAVMQALAGRTSSEVSGANAQKIRHSFGILCIENEEFRKAIEQGTNGETSIKNRINIACNTVTTSLTKSPVLRDAKSRQPGVKKL
jgi:hypothetical protein